MAMSKKEIWPFVVLLALLFAWQPIDQFIAKRFFPSSKRPAAAAPAAAPDAPAAETELKAAPAAVAATPAEAPSAPAAPAAEWAGDEPEGTAPEQFIVLSNDVVKLVLSTRGATVVSATLKDFRSTLDPASPPMELDFAARSALAYEGLPGFGARQDYTVTVGADARRATFERQATNGLRLRRDVTLGPTYVVNATDTLVNAGGADVALAPFRLRVGGMHRELGHRDAAGITTLGVDTLSPGGEKVQHLGKQLGKLFVQQMEDAALPALPVTLDAAPHDRPVDWVAAKNKYFVQILTPEGGAERVQVYARRERLPRELAEEGFAQRKPTPVVEVGAAVVLAEQTLAAGESSARSFTYYVGPKKYSSLHALQLHQVDVMEFGDWIKPISKLLLRVLNFIHDHVPPYNYGIAIILLTIIVRVLFWPITHKSTESMKRMQQVSPLVTALREKYKDNPQKQQQEIMALYKAHKVNPLGGCLPMLIQIPVFFALFVVLRSAIELRFASFLWIRDLSEPENLLPGVLPFVSGLNVLPLLMALTMWLQMKLSPSAGDPAQQKMMAVMMPIMMLVFLYPYASGLALYWTTQNALMIVQQMLMRRKSATVPARA